MCFSESGRCDGGGVDLIRIQKLMFNDFDLIRFSFFSARSSCGEQRVSAETLSDPEDSGKVGQSLNIQPVL